MIANCALFRTRTALLRVPRVWQARWVSVLAVTLSFMFGCRSAEPRCSAPDSAHHNAKLGRGAPALLAAVTRGDLAAVRQQLSSGIDANTVVTKEGETPLFYVKTAAMVDLLVSYGADVGRRDILFYSTPLHAAAEGGYVQVLDRLLNDGADIDVKSKGSVTPLYLAASRGRTEALRFLIERGANFNQDETVLGTLPITAAEKAKHPEAVALLRTAEQSWEKQGYLPLSLEFALRFHDEAAFKRQLEGGKKLNARDYHGRTLLHRAVLNKLETYVKMLLKFGADVSVRDEDGRTAMDLAVQLGEKGIIALLQAAEGSKTPTK